MTYPWISDSREGNRYSPPHTSREAGNALIQRIRQIYCSHQLDRVVSVLDIFEPFYLADHLDVVIDSELRPKNVELRTYVSKFSYFCAVELSVQSAGIEFSASWIKHSRQQSIFISEVLCRLTQS